MTQSRRRFLAIIAGLPLLAQASRTGAAGQIHRWRGVALGADAVIMLDHPKAEELTARAVAEIRRLERVFSLYDSASDLSRLNRDGRLAAPPVELLEVLALSRQVHHASAGVFDPTVQPLWTTHAVAWSAGAPPAATAVAEALALVGFDRVWFDEEEIRLGPGMALTLNGIAQGYIADRVAALFGVEGVSDVLIDTGEIVALGRAPDGGAWPVQIAGAGRVGLSGRALATSAPLGTTFDDAGLAGHILDPRTGSPTASRWRQVTINAPQAATADALSTAACLLPDRAAIAAALQPFSDARVEAVLEA